MSNLKTLQKLKELHSLYLLPELVGYPGSAIAVRGLLSLGGITGFAPESPLHQVLAKVRSESSCFF